MANNTISDDGTYQVGNDDGDILPGVWQTRGGADGASCYWERLRDTSGTADSIIANNLGEGQQIVTIAPTDSAFKTEHCQEWTKVK